MVKIAEALIIAVQYLGVDRNDEEYTEDDDVKIVEQISSLTQEATIEEKEILINVSKKIGLDNWAAQIGIE